MFHQSLWMITAALTIGLSTSGLAASARNTAVIEAAPLAMATGQVSLGGELPVGANFAVASYLEHRQFAGERDGYIDRQARGVILGQWYPWQAGVWSVFLGAGLGYDQQERGRQKLADTMTWGRTTELDRYDRWSEHEQRLISVQSLGVRSTVSDWVTVSFRYTVDQRLWGREQLVEDDINSLEPRLSEHEISRANQQFALYAGIRFP